MKKTAKSKSSPAPAAEGPDIGGLILRMQEQLNTLEKKLDILAGLLSTKFVDRRPQQAVPQQPQPYQAPKPVQPVQQPQQSQQPQRPQPVQQPQHNQRPLFKAICADCHKECEIPFRPSGNRPVYCKECFSKRKQSGNLFKTNNTNVKPQEKIVSVPAAQPAAAVSIPPAADKPEAGKKKKKTEAKKKTAVKKRKK